MDHTTSRASRDSKAQDDSIMGTNSSSIVSKRSVERLYHSNEPPFHRFFAKKFRRRSPLINRGYWLRMKAVERTVQDFLKEASKKQKVVVNLGCGYDPLPWQIMTRCPRSCVNVVFIDIDFEELLLKKRRIVQDTKELNSMLTNIETFPSGKILLRSREYIQLGCDLRDLKGLTESFAEVVDFDEAILLFVAEVSITYMALKRADALIEWAGALPNARFCLLEQIIPYGRQHPFAQTMLAHFTKLQTPLLAVEKYPTVSLQQQRFKGLGWTNVQANNLWHLWGDLSFIPVSQHRSLENIEPFDEWEDFALFACHYVLVIADNYETGTKSVDKLSSRLPVSGPKSTATATLSIPRPVYYSASPKIQGRRRFGAPLLVRQDGILSDSVANFAGMGLTTRTSSFDVYTVCQADTLPSGLQTFVPSSRMCFTTTELGDGRALLVGGRTSPNHGLKDCFLYHKWLDTWEQVEDLPQPRYRHGAVNLGKGCVLISTGKINSQEVSDEYHIWSCLGWVKCLIDESKAPPPTFGATIIILNLAKDTSDSRSGQLFGGLSTEGLVQTGVWAWQLDKFTSKEPTLTFRNLVDLPFNVSLLARFGATVAYHDDNCYIVGGISVDGLLSASEEICVLNLKTKILHTVSVASKDPTEPMPLLMGISIVSTESSLLIISGGAVCFSFGCYWNKGCWTIPHAPRATGTTKMIATQVSKKKDEVWKFIHTRNPPDPSRDALPSKSQFEKVCQTRVSIPRVSVGFAPDFAKILETSAPIILEGLDIGSCTETWTVESLKDRIGVGRKVIIHDAATKHMNFKAKNFTYAYRSFGHFLDQADGGEKVYLRSLSSEKPEVSADFWKDFSSISADFCIPPELSAVGKNIHSSVLRISGSVIMWLHYDVMANILCQIRGSKRLLLFPPSDVKYFNFEPGASSSEVNVFADPPDPCTSKAMPHEALLIPGDILFIPPLWLHSAFPTSNLSVGVNVFFRSLDTGYAAGRDVYGNRDLQAYENGRGAIAKTIESFRKMPVDMRGFYLQRLAAEFAQKAEQHLT